MKKPILIITLGLFTAAAFANVAPSPTPLAPAEAITVDAYNALKKERDELKMTASMLPQFQQELRYQSTLAERNDFAIRILNAEVQRLTAQNALLQHELDAANAKIPTPPPVITPASKPTSPPAGK